MVTDLREGGTTRVWNEQAVIDKTWHPGHELFFISSGKIIDTNDDLMGESVKT